jgi:KDO2-lipid IV(A) lauroyltransferase
MLVMFHAVRLLSWFISPFALDKLYDFAGALIFYLWPSMRRRLESKISQAMPEIDDDRELARIGRRACGSLLKPSLKLALMKRHGERFMRELQIEGLENLEKADRRGKGVILVGGHQGANALRIAVMSRIGKTYTPIYLYPFDSPVSRYYLDMITFGQDLGCDPENPVFWTGCDTVNKVREHLRRGKRVGIDFDVAGKCVVELFGSPAAVADGIARFACDTGASIVPFLLVQEKGAIAHRLIFYPPIEYSLSEDRGGDVGAIMADVARAGEAMIREAPGQWMSWFGIRQLWDDGKKSAAFGR